MKQRNMTGLRRRLAYSASALACAAMALSFAAAPAGAADEAQMKAVEQSKAGAPQPPWPEGDERGMANTLGAGTWARCAYHLGAANAKSYELSHERSNTMPLSPFGVPLQYEFNPSVSIPGTKHVFNGEKVISGEPGAQGTQMDALGHFAYYDKAWDGKACRRSAARNITAAYARRTSSRRPKRRCRNSASRRCRRSSPRPCCSTPRPISARARQWNPARWSPPPTSRPCSRRRASSGAASRRATWSTSIPAGATTGPTRTRPNAITAWAPACLRTAPRLLEEARVVLVALDNPFTDPVADGQLQQKAKPPQGMDKGLPFVIHHQNLTQAGIHNIQNANLGELAKAKVWTSCTMILPLRSRGHSGSPVRPVAIGAPDQ